MPSGYVNLMIDPHLHSPTYEQGDILEACNHITIRRLASERICFKRIGTRQLADLNSNGFLPHTHLTKDWNEACREFRMERLNRNQCKMVRISDATELIITTGIKHTDLYGRPNKHMNVDGYFRRILTTFKKQNAQGKVVFSDDGDDNKVVVYVGSTILGTPEVDTIWSAVETKTGRTEASETTYEKQPPFGSYRRRRAVLRTDDFTDSERYDLMSVLKDGDENVIKERKCFVDWEGGLSFSNNIKSDIRNNRKDPNLRATELLRGNIVNMKSI